MEPATPLTRRRQDRRGYHQVRLEALIAEGPQLGVNDEKPSQLLLDAAPMGSSKRTLMRWPILSRPG